MSVTMAGPLWPSHTYLAAALVAWHYSGRIIQTCSLYADTSHCDLALLPI